MEQVYRMKGVGAKCGVRLAAEPHAEHRGGSRIRCVDETHSRVPHETPAIVA